MIKRIALAFLSLALILSLPTISMAALEDKYDNENIFTINEGSSTLSPGVDYYFDCKWEGKALTSDFFEFYEVNISITTPDSSVNSSSVARRSIDVAEFVKDTKEDKYYFHVRPAYSSSLEDDVDVMIVVSARDLSKEIKRVASGETLSGVYSWYEVDLTIGYYSKTDLQTVDTSTYDVSISSPYIEIDEDITQCVLTFDDKSYYTALLAKKAQKFNLGYTLDTNTAISTANPNATLKCISFYATPMFPNTSVLKIYAPGKKYLYRLNTTGELTLLANEINGDYFGISTNVLSNYIASDIPLVNASSNSVTLTTNNSTTTTSTVVPSASTSTSTTTSSTTTTTPSTSTEIISNPNTGAA